MKPTDILVKEHVLIKRALDILSEARGCIETGSVPPKIFFETALDFFRSYADRFHHFKEEYIMFGMLAQKKGGSFDTEIGALRFQHDRMRGFLLNISESLSGYSESDEFIVTNILENMASYISLLRRHIYLEDKIFFPMVDKELSEEDIKILLSQFQKESEKSNEKDFSEKCRAMVQKMQIIIDE